MQQTPEPIPAAHRPVPHRWRKRDWAALLQALVRSGLVVVGDVLAQHAAQVRLAGDEQEHDVSGTVVSLFTGGMQTWPIEEYRARDHVFEA